MNAPFNMTTAPMGRDYAYNINNKNMRSHNNRKH